MSLNRFYVYTHTRPDTGALFYVGKGNGNRAHQANRGRNPHWKHTVAKAGGFQVDFLLRDVDEECALFAEIEAIDILRKRGHRLVNITAGGEGCTGLKHSEETRAKIRERVKGIPRPPCSPETRAKIGAANSIALRGRTNPEHSARLMGRKRPVEAIEKTAAALRGKKRPSDVVQKIAATHRGRVHSAEARANMSSAHKGRTASPETRARMTEAQRKRWALVPGRAKSERERKDRINAARRISRASKRIEKNNADGH